MFTKILLTSYLFFILGLGQWAAASELVVRAVHSGQNGEVSVLLNVPADIQPSAHQVNLVEDNKVTVPADAVTPFGKSEWNRALVLCIDKSGSINKKELDEIKNAVSLVLTGSFFKSQDQAALVSFENEPRFIPWASPREIAWRMDEIQNMKGRNTALYDALFDSLEHLSRNKSVPPPVLKRILLVSDGNNQGGVRKSIVDLKGKAVQAGVAIDAVLLHAKPSDEKTIRSLTEMTGGKLVTSAGAEDIAAAVEQIFTEIEKSTVVHFNRDVTVPGQTTSQVGIQVTNQSGKQFVSNKIPAKIPVYSPPEVIEDKQPEVIEDKRPEVIEDKRPEVIEDKRPEVIEDKRPEVTENKQPVFEKLTMKLLALLSCFQHYWPVLLAILLILSILLIVLILHSQKKPKKKPRKPVRFKPLEKNNNDKPTVIPPKTETLAPPQRRQTLVGGVCYPAPTANKPTAMLTCLAGSLAGQQFPIHQEIIEIGTNKSNDICITGDEYVSGRHASLCFENGALVLYDRGSSNGTFVEDTRVSDTGRTLKPGEKIRVGFNVFEVGAPPD